MLQSLYENEIMWKHLKAPALVASGISMKPLEKFEFEFNSKPAVLYQLKIKLRENSLKVSV